jgi:RNA polymerase sigma factor (TIGR02999 family)
MDRTAITQLLKEVRGGNRLAENRLFDHLQDEMRRVAGRYMRAERPGHTLQPTALVNEAYLRIFGSDEQVEWQDRAHFLAVASRHMRHILVDHARKKSAGKRGAGAIQVTLGAVEGMGQGGHEIEAVHDALEEFEKLYPVPARIVELKFFGGLTDQEAAEVTGRSFAQVRRDWEFARAWLFKQLKAR